MSEQCKNCPALQWCLGEIDGFQHQIDLNTVTSMQAEFNELSALELQILTTESFTNSEASVEQLERTEQLMARIGPAEPYIEKCQENQRFWSGLQNQMQERLEDIRGSCKGAARLNANVWQKFGAVACASTSVFAGVAMSHVENKTRHII